eukprot:787412-Prymnesium_polylepis.1
MSRNIQQVAGRRDPARHTSYTGARAHALAHSTYSQLGHNGRRTQIRKRALGVGTACTERLQSDRDRPKPSTVTHEGRHSAQTDVAEEEPERRTQKEIQMQAEAFIPLRSHVGLTV